MADQLVVWRHRGQTLYMMYNQTRLPNASDIYRVMQWPNYKEEEYLSFSRFGLFLDNSNKMSYELVRRSYQTIRNPPLPNVTRHSGGWPFTVTPSIDRQLIVHYTNVWPYYLSGPYNPIAQFDLLPNCARFALNICDRKPSSTVNFGWFVAFGEHKNFPYENWLKL